MSAEKVAPREVERTIDRTEFIKDPSKAFRLAGDGGRVVIVSPDGKARAVLSVPRTELTFDSE